MSIIITIIIFGIIVMIHEWGHFIAAKKCGVLVEEFAIGMGPKLWGKQKGETLYSIRLFPLGGFCRMADEDKENSDKRGFNNISVWKRMIIVLAGVFMNFILAIAVSSIIIMFTGYGDNVIRDVEKGSTAEAIGLKNGDELVNINGSSIHLYEDIRFRMYQRESENILIGYERDGEYFETQVNLKSGEKLGIITDAKTPLFDQKYEEMEKTGFFESIKAGFWKSVYMVKVTFYGLKSLVTMQVSLNDVSGPIGMTAVVNDIYEETIQISIWSTIINMANLAALLSANLGVMNLLPIPALDGGRFIFLIIEAIRRKPIPPEKEGMVHIIGFGILMALGIFIAFNDIFKML